MGNYDKIKEALASIESAVESINTNEDWLKYLQFQSLFYQYSYQNAILIYVQSGGQATYVKGYKSWNKLGRYVRKGERGLAILAPCFRKIEEFKEPINGNEYNDEEGVKSTRIISGFKVTHVFDYSQTEGSDKCIPVLVKGLAGNSAEEEEIYNALIRVISKDFTIKDVQNTASKGSYNLENGLISIRSDLEYLQRIKTLLHETAHGYDFEMNPDENIPRNRRELIALYSCFLNVD